MVKELVTQKVRVVVELYIQNTQKIRKHEMILSNCPTKVFSIILTLPAVCLIMSSVLQNTFFFSFEKKEGKGFIGEREERERFLFLQAGSPGISPPGGSGILPHREYVGYTPSYVIF